jgi:hypothetical protein
MPMLCYIGRCREPAVAKSTLALAAARANPTAALPRLPREAGLCAAHWRIARRGFFVQAGRENGVLTCLSLLDGRTVLRAVYAGKRGEKARLPREAAQWRQHLLGPGALCMCGREAREIGHRIPLLCFRLSDIAYSKSYFAENLDCVCRKCNIDWMHFCHPAPWWRVNARVWSERHRRLRMAVMAARQRGIPVAVPARAPKCGWPGNPVFDLGRCSLPAIIEPVAFVQDLYFPHERFLKPSEMRRPLRLIPDAPSVTEPTMRTEALQ